MKTIILNDLTVKPLSDEFRTDQVSRLFGNWGHKRLARIDIPPETYTVHQGFLDYLSLAYRNHFCVVIKPDDIWFMVLAELSLVIAKAPGSYASLFTTTPDKRQTIRVPTNDPTQINPALVIEHLKDCVPCNVGLFLPEFTTTTPNSRLAMHVAFCDMASPFYNYSTYLCGIPRITFEGTEEDWAKVAQGFSKLSALFGSFDTSPVSPLSIYLKRCYECVKSMIQAVLMEDTRYINRMVKVERCGSGSQFEMSGWILDLVLSAKQKTQLEGLPSHIASMTYKNLDTGRTFKLFTGLTESCFDGGYLVPRYGRYVVEQTNEVKKPLPPADTTLTITSIPIGEH